MITINYNCMPIPLVVAALIGGGIVASTWIATQIAGVLETQYGSQAAQEISQDRNTCINALQTAGREDLAAYFYIVWKISDLLTMISFSLSQILVAKESKNNPGFLKRNLKLIILTFFVLISISIS